MEFDIELAKEESPENPVYYVQYAHARIAGIFRRAAREGIDFSGGDPSLLTHESELALIRKMLELPELVETMARSLAPHHLSPLRAGAGRRLPAVLRAMPGDLQGPRGTPRSPGPASSWRQRPRWSWRAASP